MENKESEVLTQKFDVLIKKIENASSLLELKFFLEQIYKIIDQLNNKDCEIEDWMDINDFIDLDDLPVFSDTCPDNVDFLSDDCNVKSYDDTKLLCADGLNVWLEDREYFND